MEKHTKEKIREGILDLIINVFIIALLVVVIRSFIVAPFQVSGPSMCDTLNVVNGECVTTGNTIGEFMLINKFSYLIGDPKRGDIVVFKPPTDERFYIKRIIGLPGDTIEIKTDNFVYLTPEGEDEIKLEETYLNEDNYGNTKAGREKDRVFHVPEGGYFLMGDNRAHSSDSRHCFSSFGCSGKGAEPFITKKMISGKAFLTLWPLQNIKFIKKFEYEF